MGSRDDAASREPRGDILHRLRTETTAEHQALEQTLDLLDPALGRPRLVDVLARMHGFWLAAEAGLDDWAGRFPQDADAVTWPRRRRAGLFAQDLATLGAAPDGSPPDLPGLTGTDEALGRLYVLEGSTLGGVFIDRHLAGLPGLADVRLRAFSPYGPETGAMWHAFRRMVRDRVAGGGDPEPVVASARTTFATLAEWCRPVGVPA
jgi:heme oxygenase